MTPYAELSDRGGYDTDELDAIAAGETHEAARGLRVCVTSGYPTKIRHAGYQAEGIVYASGGRIVWSTTLTNHGGNDPVPIVLAKCEAWIEADEMTRARLTRIDAYRGGIRNAIWRELGVPV